MAITPDKFESIARAAAKSLFMDVTVSGFKMTIDKASRSGKTKYTVEAVYDPIADHWSVSDWKGGGTFNRLIREINWLMDS